MWEAPQPPATCTDPRVDTPGGQCVGAMWSRAPAWRGHGDCLGSVLLGLSTLEVWGPLSLTAHSLLSRRKVLATLGASAVRSAVSLVEGCGGGQSLASPPLG